MATTGQTINDRLNAVRYALVGQGLARTVCKATTEEVLGPKKKHIEYLLACTNEPNVSIPQLANLLIERSAHTNWAVVFKSLITMHHLMSYGNERFTQYLATSNYSFEFADFMDRTTPQGYNMSSFVRKYAKYINEKAISYRTLAIDLCKIRSGSENALRTMNMDNLSKTLPIVQSQFDSLLDFSAESKDLNNGIIMSAFRLLYKDLVKLYVAYQEAIINLLERYFKLSRKKTREALEMYKKYLARMDKVAGFLRVVEAVGLDKSEMPDLTKSPASILKLLEQHLASLEAKKRGATPANEDDEPTTTVGCEENKENEPDTKVTVEHQKDEGDEVAAAVSSKDVAAAAAAAAAAASSPASGGGGGGAGDAASAPTPSPAAEKQPPPQKPARPSPKASPKVSPSSSGSARPAPPKSSSPAAATPPAPPPPPASAAQAEKKAAPPERPAKPPSRPPPPTAAAASTAAASAATASSSSSSPKSETPASSSSQTTKADHGQQAQASKVTAHSPPPPHPPPPHPHPPTAGCASRQQPPPAPAAQPAPEPGPAVAAQQSASQAASQAGPQEEGEGTSAAATTAATAATINTASATNGDAANQGDAASSGEPAASASTGSCSAIAVPNNAAANEQAQDVETNHVNNNSSSNNNSNNVEQAVLEEEILPPPPPIEEGDIEAAAAAAEVANEAHQVAEPVQGQAAEIDPVVNGENGNGA